MQAVLYLFYHLDVSRKAGIGGTVRNVFIRSSETARGNCICQSISWCMSPYLHDQHVHVACKAALTVGIVTTAIHSVGA